MPAKAALANGFFGHASEMEDDQFPGGGISDVTTWPALLTAAEKCKLSGKEVIVALYVGQEMQNRIAMYASVGTDGIGICNLPFIGIYGATASCARASRVDGEQTKAWPSGWPWFGAGIHAHLGDGCPFLGIGHGLPQRGGQCHAGKETGRPVIR